MAENSWFVLETESRLPKEGRAAFLSPVLEVFAKQPEHASNGANEPHHEESALGSDKKPWSSWWCSYSQRFAAR